MGRDILEVERFLVDIEDVLLRNTVLAQQIDDLSHQVALPYPPHAAQNLDHRLAKIRPDPLQIEISPIHETSLLI